MPKTLFAKVIVCALTMVLLGSVGGLITSGSINPWYSDLKKPPGTPPNSIFGPVWTILYALIGTSFAFIWHDHPGALGKTKPTFWFVLQLLLNLAWTPVFFGAHQVTLALVIIVLLWIAIFFTIRQFKRFSALAGLLLFPYLAWVTYATYLNAGIAYLK